MVPQQWLAQCRGPGRGFGQVWRNAPLQNVVGSSRPIVIVTRFRCRPDDRFAARGKNALFILMNHKNQQTLGATAVETVSSAASSAARCFDAVPCRAHGCTFLRLFLEYQPHLVCASGGLRHMLSVSGHWLGAATIHFQMGEMRIMRDTVLLLIHWRAAIVSVWQSKLESLTWAPTFLPL